MDQYVVREPGKLSTKYNCEHKANMLHGGTIFFDTTSKVIHVENQVSLGSDETVMAKIHFKEWI